jgi:hypothetical protein
MNWLCSLLVVPTIAFACGTGLFQPTTTHLGQGAIAVGTPFSDDFVGEPRLYSLVAPADGVLIVRLSWNTASYGTRFVLIVNDLPYSPTGPGWSPIVCRMKVSRGRTYQVRVESHTPWDARNRQSFDIATALE